MENELMTRKLDDGRIETFELLEASEIEGGFIVRRDADLEPICVDQVWSLEDRHGNPVVVVGGTLPGGAQITLQADPGERWERSLSIDRPRRRRTRIVLDEAVERLPSGTDHGSVGTGDGSIRATVFSPPSTPAHASVNVHDVVNVEESMPASKGVRTFRVSTADGEHVELNLFLAD